MLKPGGAVGAVYSEDAPTLLRQGATPGADRDQHSDNGGKQMAIARHFRLPDPMRRSADLFVFRRGTDCGQHL
jgi:hypothetical protein